MKKKHLRQALAGQRQESDHARSAAAHATAEMRRQEADIRRLTAEVEQMKANWRPVPITHEWTPRDPQCALCDEPRDALRHAS